MKKHIKLSNNTVVLYDPKSYEGFDTIASFYEPKLKKLLRPWDGRIPFHDIDDMLQVCRMKLIDALDKYDENMNIQFSTYVYTTWHRKLAQMVYKFKSKKYSSQFDKSKNVSFNHAVDPKTRYQYLRLEKDKCPLKGGVISANTCKGCPHFLKHKTRKMTRGKDKGDKFKYSMCNFYLKVMENRGSNEVWLDRQITRSDGAGSERTLSEMIACDKQRVGLEEAMFDLEMIEVRDHMDPGSFKVLTMLVEGYAKKEIMKRMRITESRYDQLVAKIHTNDRLLTILGKQGEKNDGNV
jgi:RNA polymerase sigma factor (sigma-70 family)